MDPTGSDRPAVGEGQVQARTAIDLFLRRVAASGPEVALRHKEGGAWRSVTWAAWDAASRELAAGLRALGLERERVCLLSATRYEWVLADVAILMAGGVTVPIYRSETPEHCSYIINDSGARAVFVEDPHQLEKLLSPAVRPSLQHVARVILLSDVAVLGSRDEKGRTILRLGEVLPASHPDRGWVLSLADLRAEGKRWMASSPGALERGWQDVRPEDVFTIVYTPGTTGPPKGVVLTHANLAFECAALNTLLSLTPGDEQLLSLPLAHIFGRILAWGAISLGCRTSFATRTGRLFDDLREVRPTYMGSVPSVFESSLDRIQETLGGKRRNVATGAAIEWALGVGKRRSAELQAGRRPDPLLAVQASLADRLLFSRVKEAFGGRIKLLVSGGAPLAREVAEFFHQVGVLILEGYGLSETTGPTHVNRPNRFRFGTVGPPVPGVEVRVAPDGEVLVRGGNVMRGYYGKPEATREVLEPDGWLHTGDIGVIEAGGFLRITDRKKDLLVTAGGKNVAPQNIENALKSACPYVSQVIIVGDKRPFVAALLTLDRAHITAWARERGVPFGDLGDLSVRLEVRGLVQRCIDKVNAELAGFEQIRRFTILPGEFTQDGGELTATLKVKRKHVQEVFRDVIERLYE